MIHKYISKHFVLLLRYAKENSRKRIKCTVSPKSNTGREGTETGTKSRRCKEDTERTRVRIRTCQGNILQGEGCKTNTKESWLKMPRLPFFSNIRHKLAITLLIVDSIDDAPYMLKLLPYIWRSDALT